jgi:hypothetical protein
MAVFWVVAPCSLVEVYLMMEAARTSEKLVNFYQTTRPYNPEDSHLRTHRRENLKSYLKHPCISVLCYHMWVEALVCTNPPPEGVLLYSLSERLFQNYY